MTNTDPEKFIHEDVAIASYLILAWRHFKVDVKYFVDLGCGNGLLVYILNDQG
jgi:tRNASer (uridine44-2'-O)-methyltransferase